MSSYCPLNFIKRQAKDLQKAQGIKLSAAQEALAIQFNFNSYHELQIVARQRPVTDSRVLSAAFGIADLQDLIWEDNLHVELDQLLEDAMNSETAATNASLFSFEDLVIDSASYDDEIGCLTLTGSLTYSGEQDDDRMFYGRAFYLDVRLSLLRRGNKWIFDEQNALEIESCESDLDRDHEHELDDLYKDYLDSQ